MTIRELLETAIEDKGGNISAAASTLETTRQTLYNWLRGVVPPMDKAALIAEYCDVEEDYVLAMLLVERGIDPAIFKELANFHMGVSVSWDQLALAV